MFPVSRQFKQKDSIQNQPPKRLPGRVAKNYKELEDMIDLQIKQAKLNKLQQELGNPSFSPKGARWRGK